LANHHPCFRDGIFPTVWLQKGFQKIQLHAGQSKDVTPRLQDCRRALLQYCDFKFYAFAR
jgi:hypothetical protein